MPTVDKSVEVNAPVTRVYEAWTDFERFPEFMGNVKEVTRTGPETTHWVAEAPGKNVEWDARTTVQEHERVEWDAQGDSRQRGIVTFDDLGGGRTRVNVHLDYHLSSRVKEMGAKWFGLDDAMVENDLMRFKSLIESGRSDVTRGA